jgi:hypothetical protein
MIVMHTCWALALLGLAACGRLGFDAAGHDKPEPDAASDGARIDASDAAITVPPAFDRLCAYQAFTVIDDANAVDDATGMQLATATRAGCATMAAITATSQDAAGVLDPMTNRPLIGPSALGMVGGGSTNQRVIGYLAIADTPVVENTAGSRTRLIVRATGVTALDVGPGTYNSTHDVGYVQLTLEPISGTRIVSAIGRSATATTAIGVWFAANVPMILASAGTWFVIDWQDTDITAGPSPGDRFTIVSAG